MVEIIDGNHEPNKLYDKKTQVFYATHMLEDGKAWKSLPIMKRSFISFSYGGRKIEDFNLIVTISDNAMQKGIYGNFEDDTTQYKVINGQYHWGTHFVNNNFNFVLATDGITEDELNDFKMWFKPGYARELVLAENPNRAIMARVGATPVYSLIPFEKPVSIEIDGIVYNTSTTEYKGEINLGLISDTPFWYSRAAVIDYYYTDENNKFGSMTQDYTLEDLKRTIEDPDFLKVIIEDHVPYEGMIQTNAFLSNNMYAAIYGEGSTIGGSSIVAENEDEKGNYKYAHIDDNDDPTVGGEEGEPLIMGQVGVVIKSLENNEDGISLDDQSSKYLYYSGTAPVLPAVAFTIVPQLEDDYIKYPLNCYSNKNKPYNIITIGNQQMKFTLPSLLLGYNQAIAIIKGYENGREIAVEDVRQALILGVNESHSRAWALNCLNTIAHDSDDINIIMNFKTTFITYMKKFFQTDENGNILTKVRCFFNGEKGESYCEFEDIATISNSTPYIVFDNNDIPTNIQYEIIKQMTGDMLRSKFITIEERTSFSLNGEYITDKSCMKVSTDYPQDAGGLNKLLITYKNMYY